MKLSHVFPEKKNLRMGVTVRGVRTSHVQCSGQAIQCDWVGDSLNVDVEITYLAQNGN